jgi:hypothetical protein
VETKPQRYLQLQAELKNTRQREEEILDKMDLLWQAMTLDERREVEVYHLSWPPPVLVANDESEGNNGNG